MLPMRALRMLLGSLLAGDNSTLAPVALNNIVSLVKQPFTVNENLTLAGLMLATFTGSTPKAGTLGPQGSGIDPATQQQVVTILAPAGGWRWVCTGTPATPETLYGYILTDSTGTVILGAAELLNPLLISEIGDEIDLGSVMITFVLQPMM